MEQKQLQKQTRFRIYWYSRWSMVTVASWSWLASTSAQSIKEIENKLKILWQRRFCGRAPTTQTFFPLRNLHLRRSSRWLHRISPLGTLWRNSSWLKPQSCRPGMWMPPTSISSMPNSFMTQTAQWITWSAVHCTGSDKQKHIAQ